MRRAFRLGLGPDHVASAVDEELSFHVEMRTQQLIAAGYTPDDARREALRQFGNLQDIHQSCVSLDQDRERSMNRVRYAEELGQDLSFAVRALRRNPGFAIVAILTLALGIGANTAIFTLINAIVLRPIPVHAPQELLTIGDPSRVNGRHGGTPTSALISYPLYRDIVERNGVLSGLLASGTASRLDVRMASAAELPEHPLGRFVSANFFSVLGVPAARGRVFGPSEDGVSPVSPVAVISDDYWASRFSRDPGIIGRVIWVNAVRLTIIGVAPPGFDGEVVGSRYNIWLPLSMYPAIWPHDQLLDRRDQASFVLLGRIAAGVSRTHAIAVLRQTTHQAMVDHASADDASSIATDVPPVGDGAHGLSRIRSSYTGPLFTMLAGVALLLLIVCANVSNLLMARAIARAQEFSVRLALGAGRGRLVRQLLTESGLLALSGAAVGLLLAWVGGRGLLLLAADGGDAIPLGLAFDGRVLAFTVVVSLLAVLFFGLLPAVRATRVDLARSLRGRGLTGRPGTAGQRFPIGTVMIASQIALSLVLLIGAGLLMTSVRQLENVSVGLDRDHLLIMAVESGERGYAGRALVQLAHNLQRRLAQLPGVSGVSYSENGVFSGSESTEPVSVANWVGRTGDDSASNVDRVGGNYVAAIGGHLLAGRDLTPEDARPDASPVALVNQAFARFYFAGRSPIGQSIRLDDTTSATIVGMLADVRDHALDVPVERRFYTAFGKPLGGGDPGEINFEIRTTGDPALLAGAAQHTVAAEDATLSVDGVKPLASLMIRSITEQRMLAKVASGFGALALFLAAIGLYGVMTYAVTRRTGELGLRMALGAEPRRLVVMVIGDALRLVVVGVSVGAPLAFGALQLLRTQLRGATTDWFSILVALGVLTAAALAAALIPALRAARVTPLAALRQQ